LIDVRTFRIDDAERVRWEWFSYGGSKTPENRYFQEFSKQQGGLVVGETNVAWYTLDLRASTSEAAVEIL
jgi:hypothetical protein